MQPKLNMKRVLLGFLSGLLLVLPGAVFADEPLADIENQGDTLVFHPIVEFAELLLTVRGPCDFEYKQRVTEGELFFRLDPTTIDGVYTYGLRRLEAIDPGIIKVLLEARQSNDPEPPKALCRAGKLPGPPISQSEGFQILEGRILLDHKSVEPPPRKAGLADRDTGAGSGQLGGGLVVPTKDIVHNDDVIIDGSLCVGFDCVNGESFGFDTIRVKEHNLRIKFDDTSTAASFPRNDWQITANDSANGGASKFSIEDITGGRTVVTVEAGARSHSLYVDDGGRIGSRTSTPSVEIHTVDGDTPTLRLQQDGSSGFAPQTWDVAGNETNFFVRDVTNGSTLPFRIRPGAPTSAIDIDDDGNVGFGTASPGAQIHVDGGTSTSVNLRLAGDSAGYQLVDYNGPADEGVAQQFVNGGVWRLRGVDDALTGETVEGIAFDLGTGNVGVHRTTADATNPFTVGTGGSDGNGAHVTPGGVWTNGSSRAFKHYIEDLTAAEARAALDALSPVRYEYKLEPGEEYVGFIAEDVPDLVATNSRRYLSPMDIVAVLTRVVQEQQQAIKAQQRTIEEFNVRLLGLAQRAEAD